MFNDDLYVGLTGGGEYYNAVKQLAKANNIKTVICDKVCFVNKEDFDVYKANKKAFEAHNGYKQNVVEEDDADLYFKSFDEILNKYPNDIESIRNTQEIADKCDLRHFDCKESNF